MLGAMNAFRALLLFLFVGLAAAADSRAEYDARVRAMVGKRWEDVSAKYENSLEAGTAVIRFQISPDGKPSLVRTSSAQGAPNLVRITREMIEAMKFPPFPPDLVKKAAKGIPMEISVTVLP